MALTPYPILFKLAIGPVYTHGLFFAMGALVGSLVLVQQRHFFHRSAGWMLEKTVYIFLAGLLAARFGFFLSYPSLWDSVGQAVSFWQGGLVSYWGMLGGGLAVVWIGKSFPREQVPRWYATTVLAALLAWGVGRFGNFFAGDSVGVLSDHWSFFYGRVPIQLFESILCFGTFSYFWRYLASRPWGVVYGAIATYFVGRLVIDAWRDESAFLGLHISQWFCLGVVILLLALWRKSDR